MTIFGCRLDSSRSCVKHSRSDSKDYLTDWTYSRSQLCLEHHLEILYMFENEIRSLVTRAHEIAHSYQRLLAECDLKQEQLGERVGKNRTTVNNYLRLLKLPPTIQAAIRDQQISMGHARALINIEDVDTLVQDLVLDISLPHYYIVIIVSLSFAG